jgi:hypothetical protein
MIPILDTTTHRADDKEEDEAPEHEHQALAHGLVTVDLVHDLQGLSNGEALERKGQAERDASMHARTYHQREGGEGDREH